MFITNDANLWATETMGNAKYPLELFLREVTVSLETNRTVGDCRGWTSKETVKSLFRETPVIPTGVRLNSILVSRKHFK